MEQTVTTTEPSTSEASRPAGKRPGYVAAIVVQLVGLWVVHHLLTWGWPSFLTPDFDQVLPWITASILLTIVVNVCFLVHDDGAFRALADLATGAMGVAVGIVTWRVWPFDFSGWGTDWTLLLGLLVGVGIAGSLVSVLVNAARLRSRLARR